MQGQERAKEYIGRPEKKRRNTKIATMLAKGGTQTTQLAPPYQGALPFPAGEEKKTMLAGGADGFRADFQALADAVFDGTTAGAVARQLGVSRLWASREANSPGTRLLIAELFEANRERISGELFRTLDVIEDTFEAGYG